MKLARGLLAAILALALLPAGALGASRPFLPEFPLNGLEGHPAPFEDACGLAGDSAGDLYVSDYYRAQVEIYNPSLSTQIVKLSKLDLAAAPCGLAVNLSGRLFVNLYHRGVIELNPSTYPPHEGTTYAPPETLDSGDATGIALDPASGDLYVDDRTYIARYEAPIIPGAEPAEKIGLGNLQDGYGVAIASGGPSVGELFVPDAATDTVKVYDPATSLTDPIREIDGSGTPRGAFTSLTDATIVFDPQSGNLLLADNTEPGFDAPVAVIEELSPQGAYLGQLPHTVIDSEPPGLALTSSGNLYVTSGNSQGSAIYAFGPPAQSLALPAEGSPGSGVSKSALVQGPPPPSSPQSGTSAPTGASASEVKQQGTLRVSFSGQLSPQRLPREGSTPVHASVGTKIATTNGSDPPQLRQMKIAINSNGHFETRGLPVCQLDQVQPATTQTALAACRSSLVGEGLFEAKVLFSHQSPFPSQGKVYAFNSVLNGKPAILAHVYGTKPVPTSFTLIFAMRKSKGTFGTTLVASLPEATGNSAYVTGISLDLFRRFSANGKSRSYISAGCPAPKGFSKASFPFARASLTFKGGKRVSQTLVRSCGVGG